MSAVNDNPAQNRFELEVDGELAIVEYRIADGAIHFTHTETPMRLQGRGIASQLVRGAVESARARGLKIVPRCSYVADWLSRHPEFSN
jgi:predicted GNAT family acetyltransferase